MSDNNFGEKLSHAAKDAASHAASAAEDAAKHAAEGMAKKAGEAVHEASEATKKAAVEKLGGEYRGDEGDGNSSSNAGSAAPRKKGGKTGIIIGIVAVIAIVLVVLFGVVMPASTSKITKANTVTEVTLKKAVDIEDLSTAQFVFNGIAEKYKDNSDEVDYHISYDSTVKAGVRMSDIDFSVDNDKKIVAITLPEVVVTSVSVDVNSLSYMPTNPNGSEIKSDLTICEEDAKREAEESGKFYSYAQDNLKSVIEGLINPLIEGQGYTIAWAEKQ